MLICAVNLLVGSPAERDFALRLDVVFGSFPG
jgi:hypothetical protein